MYLMAIGLSRTCTGMKNEEERHIAERMLGSRYMRKDGLRQLSAKHVPLGLDSLLAGFAIGHALLSP